MSCLEVLDAGLQSLVQDSGRVGFASLGVPCGGAADRLSLRCANELVGNSPDAAAIEMAMLGIWVRARGPLTVCLAGAMAKGACIESVDGSRWPLPALTPRVLPDGASLHIGRLTDGLRTYLAIAGGVDVPHVLSSASTLLIASFGGHHGRALRRGDVIRVAATATAPHVHAGEHPAPGSLSCVLRAQLRPGHVRIVAGVHANAFGRGMLDVLQTTEFKVDNQSNRVGLRLKAVDLDAGSWPHDLARIPSIGMAYGAIEVPPDGSPIILGPDHPTTGGYPVIACVIAADLPALGQLGPGDTVRFELVSHEAARAAYVAQQAWIDRELQPT